MLTPADKKFLKDAFADHKKWVDETFSTKKEVREVRDSIDLARQKLTTLSLEKFSFESRLSSIEASSFRTEEKIDKLIAIGDGNAGNIADLQQENKMGAVTLRRHSIQIEELAKATKTKISR
ncbi:MAG: hypothetical protein KGH56_01430 [Patescibacteria group bacterium]|nr:hypothetical protein [Patescibacteria group bacterium]